MRVEETKLPGVLLIKPLIFQDARGIFLETFQSDKYRDIGINQTFVQDNTSRSCQGVLRGLHFQLEKPQAKLVFVTRGAVFDVVVDVRYGSPTFGQWAGFELNDQNRHQLFIPEGFAHGFEALSPEVDFFYKCTDFYHPPGEAGIRWNDPSIGIQWMTKNPIVADRDNAYPLLKELTAPQLLPYAS